VFKFNYHYIIMNFIKITSIKAAKLILGSSVGLFIYTNIYDTHLDFTYNKTDFNKLAIDNC